MGNCCSWKSDLEGVGEMQMKAQPYPFESIPRMLNHERSSNMFKISTFLTNKENIPDFFLKQEIYYKNSYSTANQAYICFNKALEIKPSDNILKENKMLFLYDWADALYDDYHMSESIERIDEYLSLANKNSSDYAKGMNLKGCALNELGNHTEALKCFNKALEISPDNEAFQINQRKLFIVVEEKRVKSKSPLGKEDIEYLANLKKMYDEIDNKF